MDAAKLKEFEFRRRLEMEQAAEAAPVEPPPTPSKREVLEAAFKAHREGKPGALDNFEAAPRDTTKYDPNESVGSRVVRAGKNFIPSAARAADAAMSLPFDAINAVAHPVKSTKAVVDTAKAVGTLAAQGYDRNIGHSGKSTAEYDEFAQGNYDKYGTIDRIGHTLAGDPFVPAVVAATAGRAVVKALPAAVKAPVVNAAKAAAGAVPKPSLPRSITKFTQGGREGREIASVMEGGAMGRVAEHGAEAADVVSASDKLAALKAAQAAKRDKLKEIILARRAERLRAAEPVPATYGAPRHADDIGESLSAPAKAAQAKIEAEMKTAYAEHTANVKRIADEHKAAGRGVSDGPKAQALIGETRARIEPDPVTRGEVSAALDPAAGGAAHKKVLDVLSDTRVDLTPEQAKLVRKNGKYKVERDPDGQEYRVTKPDLEAIENLQRDIGDRAFGKDVEGFKAVAPAHAKELYAKLTEVIDEYTGGASEPARKAWREGKQKLEAFEKVRMGQGVVGVQKGTGIPNVPTNKIPERMIAGGRDTFNQVKAVAGEGPANEALRSIVQNELAGKSAKAIEDAIKPGTNLGTIVAGDRTLQSEVYDHIARTLHSEQAGKQAERLGKMADRSGTKAEILRKQAEALTGKSASATDMVRKTQRELVDLESLGKTDPKAIGAHYQNMLNERHASGHITTEQYTQGRELIASAETAFANEATRKKWLKNAAFAVGVPSIGYMTAGPVGVGAGVGLMMLRPHVKKFTGGRR